METMLLQEEARQKLLSGAKKLNDCVKGTLGPCGRHVILQQGYGNPKITNDGVTIAKSLVLEDPYEQMGAKLVLESAQKTNDVTGDGTTTSILLTYELIRQGYGYLRQGGVASLFVEGMKEAEAAIYQELQKQSHMVRGYEEIKRIAYISAKSEEIGEYIAQAVEQVQDMHSIRIENGQSWKTCLRTQEGMELDASISSPYFFPREKKQIRMKHPLLLFTDAKIDSFDQIEHFLAYAIRMQRPIVFFCDDMESDVLAHLIVLHMQKNCKVVVCKANGFGTYRQNFLQDAAVLTHGNAYFQDHPQELKTISSDYLGSCKEIMIDPNKVQIYAAKHQAVEERIVRLKEEKQQCTKTYDLHHIEKRIARLQGKLAVIEVGGYTSSEIEEKKMRYEDALQAVSCAMEEGVVSGGGLAFIQAYRNLRPCIYASIKDKEAGISSVFATILKPFLQLMENSDENGPEMLEQQLMQKQEMGYDVWEKKWCNFLEEGVLDPLKVVYQSMHHAISIASLLIRCDAALLKDIPYKQD